MAVGSGGNKGLFRVLIVTQLVQLNKFAKLGSRYETFATFETL